MHPESTASQDAIKSQIDRLESANRNYVDQGIQILELAQEVYSLYKQRNLADRKELLNLILSNCIIDDLTLYSAYKKPFDLIAEGLKTQLKLPEQDDLRTFLPLIKYFRIRG